MYDIKHDLRYKARLVAGGHLTEQDPDQLYSGVVSLKAMCRVVLVCIMDVYFSLHDGQLYRHL